MTDAEATGAPPPDPAPAPADGWRRLHPATPLLRGGVVLIAVLVWIVVQLRDVWVAVLLGDLIGQEVGPPSDPAARWVLGNLGLALGGVALLLVVILVGGWLSWRMHSYRVTADVVEEREGIVWRKHRRARLDRIQGVNVERPVLARIFGAARVEISVAGENANIRLYALGSSVANALREELLIAASRARADAAAEAAPEPTDDAAVRPDGAGAAHSSESPAASGGRLAQRLQEFTAPELDAELRAPDSIVRMRLGRLLGSTALSLVIPVVILLVVVLVPIIVGRQWGVLFLIIPAAIAFGAFAVQRVTRSLRYSIAATEHGIRVGFGLLSTTNETLPAGRIHAIEVTQPLLWRPFGWWSVRINRASRSTRDGAAGQSATSILPVGDAADVAKVIDLMLPGLDLRGALGAAGDRAAAGESPAAEAGPATAPLRYTTSPPRARVIRWFSWRRNGYALAPEAVLLRKGAIWRTLTIVPFARVQSLALTSGPVGRALRVRTVAVHTVAGTIMPTIGAIDVEAATALWDEAERRTLEAMSR